MDCRQIKIAPAHDTPVRKTDLHGIPERRKIMTEGIFDLFTDSATGHTSRYKVLKYSVRELEFTRYNLIWRWLTVRNPVEFEAGCFVCETGR